MTRTQVGGWPGPRRQPVQARLTAEEIGDIDLRAESEGLTLPRGGVNRSEMVRLLIRYGMEHMPHGWRPA